MNRRRNAVTSSIAALAIFTMAGCGTASSDSQGSDAEQQSDTAGQRAAAEYLATYAENPTDIGDLEPLEARPPTGKSLIYLVPPTPVAHRSGDGLKAAAETLGWTYSTVDAGFTPASTTGAFSAAIARDPDIIVFGGTSASTLTKPIEEANAAGIVVATIGTADGPTEGVLANLGGAEQEAVYGKLVASYFVSHATADATAAVVTLSEYPIFTSFVDSFVEYVDEWCPDCSTEVLNQQVTDLGTKMPANIVAFLQRNKDAKWLIGTTGDLVQGARPAITAAGLEDISIIGEVPNAANLEALSGGSETAWAGYAVDILSWRLVDVLARHFAGEDISKAVEIPLPVQMLTRDNVEDAVVDDGYYVGVEGFEDQFAKLWQVG